MLELGWDIAETDIRTVPKPDNWIISKHPTPFK